MDGSLLSRLSIAGAGQDAATSACLQADAVSGRLDKPASNEDVKLAFGRRVKEYLEPISGKINDLKSVKVKTLEAIASIKDGGQGKSNLDRIVSVIIDAPVERKNSVLAAFRNFLTLNKVIGKDQVADFVAEITNISNSYGNVETYNEIKALQNQHDLLGQQHTKEKSEFLEILEQNVSELEPEWFEDKTYVARKGGDYTVHIGKPGPGQASDVMVHIPEGALPTRCGENAVTFKSGVMHSTTIQNEVHYLIDHLQRKELSHNDRVSLVDYSTTRVRICSGADHLLSIYLLPENEKVDIKFLRTKEKIENRSDLPSHDQLNTDVLVNIEDLRVFTALSHCLINNEKFCQHPMISLDNFLKFDLITFTGEKQVFLDLFGLFLKGAQDVSPDSSRESDYQPSEWNEYPKAKKRR